MAMAKDIDPAESGRRSEGLVEPVAPTQPSRAAVGQTAQSVPTWRVGLRRRALAWRLGLVGLALMLVVVGGLVPNLVKNSLPPRAVSPASTEDPTRYSDGIPRTWGGAPVLRGSTALGKAAASTDESPFLIAFWAGIETPHGCPLLQVGQDPLYSCGFMDNVGDQPGLPSAQLEQGLRVTTSATLPGPVIARVHTHDPEVLAGCPTDSRKTCEAVMVGEVVWSGDSHTAPHPVDLATAARSLGASDQPVSDAGCPAEYLPGVPILERSMDYDQSVGATTAYIAVFPSPEALARVAPQAASAGESNALVGTQSLCSDQSIRWLARANVLVGVEDDSSAGSTGNVGHLRGDLGELPSR